MTNTDYITEKPQVEDAFIGLKRFDLSFMNDGDGPERQFSLTKGLNMREAIEQAPAVVLNVLTWSRFDKDTKRLKLWVAEKQDQITGYLNSVHGAKDMLDWGLIPVARAYRLPDEEWCAWPGASLEELAKHDPDYITNSIQNWNDCLTQRLAAVLQRDPEMDELLSRMTNDVNTEPQTVLEPRRSDEHAEGDEVIEKTLESIERAYDEGRISKQEMDDMVGEVVSKMNRTADA
jgi:hypothetical protein